MLHCGQDERGTNSYKKKQKLEWAGWMEWKLKSENVRLTEVGCWRFELATAALPCPVLRCLALGGYREIFLAAASINLLFFPLAASDFHWDALPDLVRASSPGYLSRGAFCQTSKLRESGGWIQTLGIGKKKKVVRRGGAASQRTFQRVDL